MDGSVFALVLFAALMHAGWNAAVKLALDPLHALCLIIIVGAVIAVPVLAVTGLPAAAALPAIIATGLIHTVYNFALVAAYRAGGLGVVYPVARGGSPLIVTLVSVFAFGQSLAPNEIAAVACLVTGIMLLSFAGGMAAFLANRRAFGFAAIVAVAIASYSLVDAHGARVSGNPIAYAMVLFLFDAATLVPYVLWRDGKRAFIAMAGAWKPGVAGGLMQLIGYTIIIWAFAHAPVALVSALRETSVLFAAILAVYLLKEPFGAVRAVATLLVCAGAILLKLA